MKHPFLTACLMAWVLFACDDDGGANNVNNANNINNVNNINNGLCGDALIGGAEECDLTALGGHTCTDFGFEGGTLGCTEYCLFNFHECTGQSEACATATSALAADLYETIGACAVAVRLDHETLEVLGYAVFCGGYGGLDEAGARQRAVVDTGIDAGATLVNPDDRGDGWLFLAEGAAAFVNAENGLTVFGGTWEAGAEGDLTWPAAWRAADELADDCPPSGGTPHARGFDLTDDASALEPAQVDAAVERVARTALMAAFWQGGYVFHTTVLRYARSTDPVDPFTSEWIVLVGGGWLE